MIFPRKGCAFHYLYWMAAVAGTCGAQNIQSFAAPFSAYGIAAGSDGALWLTPSTASSSLAIGRMTTGGTFSQFPLPAGYIPGGPIIAGPDGNLWIQAVSENDMGIVSMTTSGVSSEYAFGLTDGVYGMTVGPDGAIWLAEGDRIGRITTTGTYTHFLVGNYYPVAITGGPDGNLWFLAISGTGSSVIGKVTPAGVPTIYPFSGEIPIYGVTPMVAGPDGAIWFTIYAMQGSGLPAIGRITTTGVISTVNIPDTSAYNFAEGSIAASPDGGLWFTGNGAIGRVTTAGVASVYPLTAPMFSTYAGYTGQGITAGSDGAMWFAPYGNNSIGRATLSTGPVAPYISQIMPNSIAVGSAATPLRILGSALAGTSSSPCSGAAESVTWSSTPLAISSATASEIDVTVPANLLTTAGAFTVSVSVSQINGTSCQMLMASSTVEVTGAAKTPSTTQLTASPNPAIAGQAVKLSATVSASAATGTVTFYDGSSSLGTATLSAGSAALSIAFPVGSHSLTAAYSGDSTYASSASTTVTLAVSAAVAPTTTTLTAVPTSQSFGDPVTLTAIVTPSTATGMVNFLDGTTSLGSVPLSGGTASLSISTLAAGSHTLSAAYSGDANDAASNSSPVAVTIANSNVPSILAGGIVNAASYAQVNGAGSPVAPGSLVAIFTSALATQPASFTTATLPAILSGVSVTFNGVTAPMVTVSPSGPYPFVSAQVPFEVAPGTASVIVNVNGLLSAPVQTQIVASEPGIFTLNAEGTGQAVLVNLADYTIAGPSGSSPGAHPIPRGQPAFFYLTGVGGMTPSVPDGVGTCPASNGLCVANAMPTVFVGGVQAQVAFAGQAAPFPGVAQINLTIPASAATGNAVSLVVISADGTVTSNMATIAVQ